MHGFRRDGGFHDAESLLDAERRHGFLPDDDERHDHDEHEHDDGHVQNGNDQGRHVHDVHQRRHEVLQDDPGLLHGHDDHDGVRLHLLHDDEQHAGLLRHDDVILSDREGRLKSPSENGGLFLWHAGVLRLCNRFVEAGYENRLQELSELDAEEWR